MRKHNILTVVALTLLAALGACSRKADTKPLDAAGVRYSVITKLEEMNVSANEVANVARAKDTGLSDEACLELVRLSRSRGGEFNREWNAIEPLTNSPWACSRACSLPKTK